MGKKEDVKFEKEEPKLKESVAALSVKSDSNFVQWQKSFGKHDAQSDGSKKRNREGEHSGLTGGCFRFFLEFQLSLPLDSLDPY